jgi:hypothetical protein
MSISFIEAGRVHSAAGAFGGAATAATNATPIVVTFGAAHGLVDGDQVQGSGFATNTAANALVYAKVTGYSTTTIGLYSDSALTVPVAGNGATSTGAVSMAYDISGLTGDVTVFVRTENEAALKGCIVSIQDSADGFVADIRTIALVDTSGTLPVGGVTHSIRKYEMPQARFGVANARLRLYVTEIDSSSSVTLTLYVQ